MGSRQFKLWLALLMLAVTSAGCGRVYTFLLSLSTRKAAQRNAKVQQALDCSLAAGTNAETRAWNEFRSSWPYTSPNAGWTYDKSTKGFNGGLAAAALIEDRYVLKCMMDFEASEEVQHFEFSKLQYHFYEIKSVRLPRESDGSGGGQYITYNPTNQKWFGPKEWKKLVESGWDFSRIGVHVVSNAPVPNVRTLSPSRW